MTIYLFKDISMPLRITRSVGSVFYGGENLDANNLEGSFEHRVYVRGVVDLAGRHEAHLNVHSRRLGHQEFVLEAGGKGLQLTDDVYVEMTGVQPYFTKPHLKCPECGRAGSPAESAYMLPQAKLLVGGPRSYQIVRDDARKKK
tara:strand:- start:1798 stop:2229 length:432 start_codon:yes stop_codon:yes gene_type:complete